MPDLPVEGDTGAVLCALAARIDARYRYWELLAIVDAGVEDNGLLDGVPNLRLLKVRPETGYYRRRVIAASEAIGDLVAIVAIEEIDCLDVVAMIDSARETARIVSGRGAARSLMDPLLRVLGRAGGFDVDTRDMLTAAFPRSLLLRMLALPDPELALRFVPRDAGLSASHWLTHGAVGRVRSLRQTRRRLSLVRQLLISGAPRVLDWVSVLSALVTVTSVLYALYAVLVWAVSSSVAPGWLTLSLAISMTGAFLAVALFGLSTGLQRIITMIAPDRADDVVDERNGVDLFSQVAQELNIELSSDVAKAAPQRKIS
jgi:type IV secretory pathway TrbD component